MIRVALADDHSIVRTGFRMLLETDPDIVVVGEAADGTQAYNLVAREHPDVLLLDISMPPGQSGLIACENIAGDYPDVRILILTMFAEPEYLHRTMRSGAAGYLVKNATAEELTCAVHAVVRGETYVHAAMADIVRQYEQEFGVEGVVGLNALSTRELEILQLLARGFTNKQISDQVFLSVKTIETHRARIYSKLGLSDRADLVDFAIKHKLLNV